MRPIGPMSAVERFIERLFERPSARIFGTRIQAVQLQRRVERAMEQGQVRIGDQARVPDRMTIRLAPEDMRRLDRVDDLPVTIASSALEWARRMGYVLAARPRVAITPDGTLRRGDIDVEARFSGSGEDPDRDPVGGLGGTRVFTAPLVESPRAKLLVRDPDGRERTLDVAGQAVSFGRAADNAIVLADPRASRHHARLEAQGGVLVLRDLHSTNGTRSNGMRITQIAVGEGDTISMGETTIAILVVESD